MSPRTQSELPGVVPPLNTPFRRVVEPVKDNGTTRIIPPTRTEICPNSDIGAKFLSLGVNSLTVLSVRARLIGP